MQLAVWDSHGYVKKATKMNKILTYRTWNFQAAAPACTELETIVLDWVGKMINLPDDFLSNKKGSKGGGVIQVTNIL